VVNFHNANRRPYELVGMTGKFHKSWGDFGTLKNRAALEFECFRMIASGVKCCVGDQMHPSGQLDPAVYRMIGEVYQNIKDREPWCVQSRKVAEIGVITANRELAHRFEMNASDEGVMRMLMELHQPFDFIHSRTDLNAYKLIILPDFVCLTDELARKLEQYLARGGKLLLTHRSGLNLEQSAFASPAFGVRYLGPSRHAPEYVRLKDGFRKTIEPMDYCFYEEGIQVEALPGAQILGEIVEPYFNRAYDRFSSHCQTPPAKLTNIPAIVKTANVIYISKPIFKDYKLNGVKVYRDIVKNCMDMLYPEPLLVSDLPTTAEVTVRRQPDRHVLHLLHYVPQKRSQEIEIVEDVIPLYNRTVRLRLPEKPSRVYVAPERKELHFTYGEGYVQFVVPEIVGHQMVVFE